MRRKVNRIAILTGGGDVPDVDTVPVGLLGCDFAVEDGRYRIARIYRGENWNPGLRAPDHETAMMSSFDRLPGTTVTGTGISMRISRCRHFARPPWTAGDMAAVGVIRVSGLYVICCCTAAPLLRGCSIGRTSPPVQGSLQVSSLLSVSDQPPRDRCF